MEDTSEVNKIIDIGDFVRNMVEEWDLDQLMEYAMENLNDFYNKHNDIFEADYKLFLEDREAPDGLPL